MGWVVRRRFRRCLLECAVVIHAFYASFLVPLTGCSWTTINRRNPQAKKHKTWEGDGVLVLDDGSGTIYDTDSKWYVLSSLHSNLSYSVSLGSGKLSLQRSLVPGDELTVAGKDVSSIFMHYMCAKYPLVTHRLCSAYLPISFRRLLQQDSSHCSPNCSGRHGPKVQTKSNTEAICASSTYQHLQECHERSCFTTASSSGSEAIPHLYSQASY